MEKIVREAYVKAMNDNFVRIINLAKTQKYNRDFLAEMSYLPKNHPFRQELAEAFQDAPSPKVISVSNGLQFSQGNQKFTITLGDRIGEVKVDGKTENLPPGKTWSDLMKEETRSQARSSPFIDSLLPKAQAGALKLLGEAVWQGTKWAAKGAAIGGAGGAATFGSIGCIGAIHFKSENKSWGEACAEGGSWGAITGAVLGSGALALSGGYVGYAERLDDAKYSYTGKQDFEALKAGSKTVLKAVGSLGFLFSVAHVGAQALTIVGADITCTQHNPGGYTIVGKSWGAKKEIYSSDGKSISRPGGCSYRSFYKYPGERGYYDNCSPMDKQEDVAKWMKGRFNTPDDLSAGVAKTVWAEHESMVETCKKNPGKTWKVVTTDTKQLTDGPPAKGTN